MELVHRRNFASYLELETFHHVCYGMGEGGGQLFWSCQIRDGRDGRDALYVRDAHDALVLVCERDAPHVCGGVPGVSLQAFLLLIEQLCPAHYFRDYGCRLQRGEETRDRKKWLH